MSDYRYQDWLSSYGKVRGAPYSEEEARRRFDAQETVTVLVGDPAAPDVVVQVELGGTWIFVMWLDRLARPELTYLWAQLSTDTDWPKGKVLLHRVHSLTHDHDQRLPEALTSYDESYTFRGDGSWVGRRGHRGRNDSERTAGESPEQLQVEDVPAFGQWQPFLRRER